MNIIVQNKVFFDYTGKCFANKINQYQIIASFTTIIIITEFRVTRVANMDTHWDGCIELQGRLLYF